MDLDLSEFDLPTAVDDALLPMRERAGRRGITLERYVDERLGKIRADQRKAKQVLLNLLSNAVKFTPEGGRIDVRAAIANGTVEISVTDTGIGIAAEDREAVFSSLNSTALPRSWRASAAPPGGAVLADLRTNSAIGAGIAYPYDHHPTGRIT